MRKLDFILYIVCFLALMVAFYDLIQLDKIEDDTLARCNKHWMKEFRNKCSVLDSSIVLKGGRG